jgi:uncharacterized protein (TIGR03086 family)
MRIEKTATLPVGVAEAFALITEPDRLRRWQAVTARVDLRVSGEYRWTVVPGYVAAGTYQEVEPGKRVVFGWGWEGSPDLGPDASTITVTLEPVDGGTLVRLVHEGLDEQQAASHAEGWDHFLDRLERAAATGDAGADEWAAAPEHLDHLSCADATLAVCQQVLRGVGQGDMAKPTPCTEFTVAQLVDHLVESLAGLAAMAGGEVTRAQSGPGGPGDLESRVAFAAQQTLETWRKRGLDGTVKLGDDDIPASFAAGILSLELLIHGWDLATATGQKVEVSDEVTTYVLGIAETVISPQVRASGSFAEAVQVGSHARPLDRLVAFSGRTAV